MSHFDTHLRIGGARLPIGWWAVAGGVIVLASWLVLGLALGGARNRISALEARLVQIEADKARLRERIRAEGDLAAVEATAAARSRLAAIEARRVEFGREREALRAAVGQARADLGATRSAAPDRDAPKEAPAAPGGPDAVAAAQRTLTELGYGPLAADGVLGRATRRVLERFQRDRGLDPTGALDAPTASALATTSPAATE